MSDWKLNEDSTGVLTLEYSGDIWKQALDKSFEENVKSVKIDGFREGKVPREVYDKKIGVETLYQKAIDFVLEPNYADELAKHNIVPVSYPDLNIKSVDENKIELELTIAISPELTLGEYKNLEIEVPVTEVSDELIDMEIKKTLEQHAQLVVKEGSVEPGDIAVIDFEGFKDGEPFDGGKAENHSLEIGSNSFIPGFEEAVIGMSVGDEKDIDVTFPDEYHVEDLAGAPVVFKVKVNEVKNREVPTLTDEFVKELDGEEATTADEYLASVKTRLEESVKTQQENTVVDMIMEKVADNSTVTIPKQMIDTEITRMLQEMNQQLSMQGINLEQYFEMTNTSEADMREQMRGEAEKRIKHYLTLDKLITTLNVEVSDDEVDKELEQLASMYNMDIAQIEQAIGGREQVIFQIKAKKVFEELKKVSKITEVEKTA